MARVPAPLVALVSGLCLAAATPPWGFWPLAFVGLVGLDHVLIGATGMTRFGRAWIVWAGLLFPSMLWMRDLSAPGYVIAAFCFAGFLASGTMLVPRGRGRYLALPAGVMVAEWVRWRWPFGGVPLSNLAIGQIGGPLAPMLRLGGALFVVGMTVSIGMAIAAAVRRETRLAVGLAAFAALVLAGAAMAPSGSGTGTFVDVALVQGGGPQGTRAATTEPGIVFERHLAASEDLHPGLDLILWPEDVVDVTTLVGSPEEAALAALARTNDATLVAGIIEDEGADRFHNWSVAYDPDGVEIDRYEKVERVPFGEWVPLRSLLEPFAGGALPERDAAIGQTPAVVQTPAGTLGVSISWEIFFGERARDAINAGGQLLINPTNGSSFTGTQVQTQQVASSRMRAIESGRWVTQIAPTGFSAVIEPDGTVRQRTAVSERAVLYDTVELRSGRTIYTRYGDTLAIAFGVVALAAGWVLDRRDRRTSPAVTDVATDR